MIKVEVIESFTLFDRFNEVKKLVRKNKDKEGYLFAGDVFECNKDLAFYLEKGNKLGRPFIKVIEVIPEKIVQKEETTEKTTEEVKPRRRRKRVE